jgi:heterodisulfide reductase subunit A-like polyferredoxin
VALRCNWLPTHSAAVCFLVGAVRTPGDVTVAVVVAAAAATATALLWRRHSVVHKEVEVAVEVPQPW